MKFMKEPRVGRASMTLRFARVSLFILTVLSTSHVLMGAHRSPLPPQGIVPDEITAVKIAEAVFAPIFGAEEVAKFRPYHAQLKDGFWTVYGTLQEGSLGGTPELIISKKDARVVEVWHSQ
jgi:hypothetical protein